MYRPRGILFASCLCAFTAGAVAAAPNVQFSAQTVQSSPDKTTRHAQIYVGDNQVRLEYQQDGQQMVEIYDMKNQRALLLMPQQRSYMERKLPAGGAGNPMLPSKETNPCAMLPKAQCKELGRETLHGRPVIKWEMVVTQDDQPLRSLHWIDAERNMPLRQTFPDGTTSEMRLVDKESLDGRATERWELTTTRSDGESMTSTQWYDPQLKIAIREELPGGYFRELRNIKLGDQSAQLFAVPAGYKLTKAPPRQPSAAEQTAPKQAAPQQSPAQQAAPQQAPAQQQRAPYPVQQQAPAQQQRAPYPTPQAPAQQQAPYPAQQYPAQQYPGQQAPAQQYPAQPYPRQQYPVQQYPGQQYPGR